jgi:hypothetical protein
VIEMMTYTRDTLNETEIDMTTNKTFNQVASVADYEEFFQCRTFAGIFMKMKELAHEVGMRKGREFEDEIYKKYHNEFVISFMTLVIKVAEKHYGKVETYFTNEDIKVNREEFLKWAEEYSFTKAIQLKLWKDFEYM